MLEHYYKERRSVADFRRGVLGPYFDPFTEFLQEKGYSDCYAKTILGTCCQFNVFLMDEGVIRANQLSVSLVEKFLDVYLATSTSSKKYNPSTGPNRLVEANGEIVTIPTTQLEIITPSPMISNLSHAVPGFFTLQWAGGRAPFQLLFRENLDEAWNLIEEGIITRSVTIPLDNTKSGFYGIRSTR